MAQWLRALTADLKINGSNPDGVQNIFIKNIFIKHIFIIYTNHSLTIFTDILSICGYTIKHAFIVTLVTLKLALY